MADKHEERTKRHGMTILGVIVVVALLVGSFVLYPAQWHSLLSFVGSSGATTTILSNGNPGICPANSQAPVVQLAARNYSPVAGAITLVAAPDNITASSTNNQTVIANTKLTVGAYITLSTPGCGLTYTNIAGDNLGWLENKSSGQALPGTAIQLQPEIFQISTPSPLVSNSPQTAGTTNAIVYPTTSSPVTVYESILAGRAWTGFPGEGFLVVYTADSYFVSSMNINGCNKWAGGQIPVSYTVSNMIQYSCVFPAINYGSYAVVTGTPSSQFTNFGLQITPTSGFSTTGQNVPIGETVLSLSNFQGVNGQWYTGQATYTVPGIIAGQTVGTVLTPKTTSQYFVFLEHQ